MTDVENSNIAFAASGLPAWIMAARGAEFASGAALAVLDGGLRATRDLPLALWRDRLALAAAEAALRLHRRSDSVADMRDAICLTRPGEARGPAGELFAAWRQLARLRIATPGWPGRLAALLSPALVENLPVQDVLASGDATPVDHAAAVLARVLERFPREEVAALMLADVALARGLGWDTPVPMLAGHLARRDLPGAPPDVHRAVTRGCDAAVRLAADLTRRALVMRAVAPKLRTRGAAAALDVFLSHDAVSPSGMLSPRIIGGGPAMTDRAARRFCDRLVELGVARELTGRSSFRLYGV